MSILCLHKSQNENHLQKFIDWQNLRDEKTVTPSVNHPNLWYYFFVELIVQHNNLTHISWVWYFKSFHSFLYFFCKYNTKLFSIYIIFLVHGVLFFLLCVSFIFSSINILFLTIAARVECLKHRKIV